MRPLLISALLLTFTLAPAQATIQAENIQKTGWMRGGWGRYRVRVTLPGAFRVIHWTAHWIDSEGKPIGDFANADVNEDVKDEWKKEEVGYLPPDVAAKGKPRIDGTITIFQNAKETALPFRFDVPEAVLDEPLKTIKGKTVAIAVKESRYKTFKTSKRALGWIDRCYQSMIDLTGEKPFGGKIMTFKESPAHPWWAYAGEEMILNTDYVGGTLQEFDKGYISFGWVHEVGHNFDVLGDWYIWSGPAAEFQANFKLCYALESLGNEVRINCRYTTDVYGPGLPYRPVTPSQLIDSFFMAFGDGYLADPTRKWDSMSSDEIHSLFMRIEKTYGWEPFKRWYRTYRRLATEGKKPPETSEEKIGLIIAILNKETGNNLTPAFRLWRMPVDKVDAMREKYEIK